MTIPDTIQSDRLPWEFRLIFSTLWSLHTNPKIEILIDPTCRLILTEPQHCCHKSYSISMSPTSKAVIMWIIYLHTGMLVVMKVATGHSISANFQPVVFCNMLCRNTGTAKVYPNRTQRKLKNPYKSLKITVYRDLMFYSNSIISTVFSKTDFLLVLYVV